MILIHFGARQFAKTINIHFFLILFTTIQDILAFAYMYIKIGVYVTKLNYLILFSEFIACVCSDNGSKDEPPEPPRSEPKLEPAAAGTERAGRTPLDRNADPSASKAQDGPE